MKLKCAFEGPPWLIQFQLLWRAFFLAKFPHFSSMLSFSDVFLNFVPYSRSLLNIGFCHFRSTHVALITISCAFTWKILFKLYKLIQSNFSPSGFFLIFHVLKMIKKTSSRVCRMYLSSWTPSDSFPLSSSTTKWSRLVYQYCIQISQKFQRNINSRNSKYC